MPPTVVWSIAAFLIGMVLGVLTTLAAFAPRLAVLEARTSRIDQDHGKLDRGLDELRRDLNGIGTAIRRIAVATPS